MTNRRRHPSLLLILSPFLVLSSLTTFFGNLTAAAQCLPDQSSALLRLKEGFSTNRSTTNLGSWKSGTDCCDHWEGVSCDPASSGRVTALDLSNRFISGRIDTILFNLTSLSSLNLAYNLFNQSLPSSGFEKLANLTRLNLSNAGFYGQIPSSISRLTKLVSLDLSTFFLDEVPSTSLKLRDPDLRTLIADLSNLRELYLDGINISSDGSEWCKAVSDSTPGLQALSLSDCSLSGPIHSSLSRLRLLSKLRLDQNSLESSVPEFFANFSSLRVLHLSSCGLTGLFPTRIFQLRNLTLLDVSGNTDLSGNLPEFPQDSTLESLVLSDTNFSGALPGSIGNLESLTELQLSRCRFSGVIPSSLGNLTQLVHLDLSFNNLSGELPSMVRWRSISEVVLKSNRLTGSITSALGNRVLPNLTLIDLTNNSLSGTIPASLFSQPSLQNLLLSQNQFSGHLEEFSDPSSTLSQVDLSNNKLQGPIPKSVFRLSGLKILNLASNSFTGAVALDLLRSLRNLTNLDLSNNRLSVIDGDDNSSWASFPNISTLRLVSCNLNRFPGFLRYQDGVSTLDLSMNRIGGSIPRWIWNTGKYSFNYLNLSFNMFTSVEGPLPDLSGFSSMILDLHANMLQGPIPLPPQNTIVLDYSNNSFASSIPSNFGAYLSFTIFLSLSSNRLAGEIPPSICNASYLQVLDLSNNRLTGLIPSCLLDGSNRLGILNLRGNRFHGSLPQNFNENCALRTINLHGNQLSGPLPRSLANCSMLEVLDLGNNHIVDSFPYWLGKISTLRVLVLRSNEFYGHVGPPAEINDRSNGTFQMLQIFDLSSNNLSGSLPSECFRNLKAMMAIPDFNLSAVDYRYLEFGQSSYYQNSVTVISKGLELTLVRLLTIFISIDFSSNRFEGGIPLEIGELSSLVVLNMSRNALAGEILPQLGNLRQLESLDLSFNDLSGEIPQQLTTLTFLSSLNLSYNNLSGRVPQGSQFSTFISTSFIGNEGLCGSPVSKQCNSVKPPAESSNSSKDLNWQFIFTGLGFGVGFAMVVGPLMVWTKGKRWYNELVDRLLWAIVPKCHFDTCGDGRVGDEDIVDDTLQIEEEGRRFCVFCTKLQFVEGRVIIQHVECSCHRLEE